MTLGIYADPEVTEDYLYNVYLPEVERLGPRPDNVSHTQHKDLLDDYGFHIVGTWYEKDRNGIKQILGCGGTEKSPVGWHVETFSLWESGNNRYFAGDFGEVIKTSQEHYKEAAKHIGELQL